MFRRANERTPAHQRIKPKMSLLRRAASPIVQQGTSRSCKASPGMNGRQSYNETDDTQPRRAADPHGRREASFRKPRLKPRGNETDMLTTKGYERGELLGRGGYGAAYKARRKDNGKVYVAKFQKYGHMGTHEREQANREVANMRAMNHPHVVRFRESFYSEHHLWIIMDLCDGGDLQTQIAVQNDVDGEFQESQVLRWLAQLLSAVDYLHASKILHRDIKPGNIFLHQDSVKLGDLGISKQATSVTQQQFHTQFGTAIYMAPEMHDQVGGRDGRIVYTKSIDIWAVGCVLYELLMLRHPFLKPGDNQGEMQRNIIRASYPDVRGPWSAELKDMVPQILQREPFRRPTTSGLLRSPLFRNMLQHDVGAIRSQGLRHQKAVHDGGTGARGQLLAADERPSPPPQSARGQTGPNIEALIAAAGGDESFGRACTARYADEPAIYLANRGAHRARDPRVQALIEAGPMYRAEATEA